MTTPGVGLRNPPRPSRPSGVVRLGVFGLPVLASFGSLLTLSGGFFAFRLVAAALIVVAVLRYARRQQWDTGEVFLLAATSIVVLGGAVNLAVSRPWSQDALSEYLAVVLTLCLTLAGRRFQRRDRRLPVVLCRGWVLAGLVASGIALWEVATGQHLQNHLAAAVAQPSAGFGNPNGLAVFLVLASIWGSVVRGVGNGVLWRLAAWTQLVLTPFILWQCGARGAILVWLVCCAWLLLRRGFRWRDRLATTLKCGTPLAIALAVIVIVPLLAALVRETAEPESSGNVRLNLTLNGLKLLWRSYGLGTGPGSFEGAMVAMPDALPTGVQVNAHNVWLEFLVQYGVLPFVLIMLWLALVALRRSSARNPVCVAVVALLPLGLLDSSLLASAQLGLTFFTIGILSRWPAPDQPRVSDRSVG